MCTIKWFEMNDIVKIDYNDKSWIPLCAYLTIKEEGNYGYENYKEEFFSCVSVLFPLDKKEIALKCDWGEVNKMGDNKPYAEADTYYRSNRFFSYDQKLEGEYIVLQQYFDTGDQKEWYLSEDLILALGLKRKGDSWYRPEEDYIEVARLKRKANGEPALLEIKTEFLKDYLCARNSGLLHYFFQSRNAVKKEIKDIEWKENNKRIITDWGMWEGIISEIVEGGKPFDAKVKVFHAERTDVDFEEDVPVVKGFPSDENVKTKTWEYEYKGKKLFHVSGEIWKKTWIYPAQKSPRVRNDDEISKIEFIISAQGEKSILSNMNLESRWIWFLPDVVNEILKRPNGLLSWYTENTGKLGTSRLYSVHFGMNDLGLINVYAKDIGELPEHQQKIWSAYNITPDGKVSKELLMSQMAAKPANTFSPEHKLYEIMSVCDTEFSKYSGSNFYKDHKILDEYWLKIHRFRALDQDTLFQLCKDLYRFVIERINLKCLKNIRPKDEDKLGSIKRIENILNELGFNGKKITAPFVGLNELRQADAHLPSSDLENSFALAEINQSSPYVIIGKNLIDTLAGRLYIIARILNEKNT